ncbi:MAG: hypothetical protein O6650_07365 [Actinobacteria bacterium]|nr:hypothetical protein [Actinomycetota bacterium]MCZ6568038.1 hypothetical protein [Actinomycetota bacterium]
MRSQNGSLISVYVDRPSPGGFGALLTDLVRPVRERSRWMGRRVEKSVRADADRIHDLAETLEVGSAPAYAIFASGLDDLFLLEPLPHPTPNVSTIGPRPYLRPLRAAPRALRSGIVVADRALARIFVGFEGVIDELSGPADAEIGKSNFGGFSGYQEKGVRAHADEVSARLWRKAGARLLEQHLNQPFDYLAIGGHEETVEEIARSLHPYLARLPRATFVANPNGMRLATLRAEMAVHDIEIGRHRQEALAGRICDTAWGGGNAVLGLNSTLEAANAQAIDTLAVAGPFTRSGVICSQCGHLSRNGDSCPMCDSPMFAVDDVVAAVMDATVLAGGRAYQLNVASPLDVEGIGALTRFPVPS